jgi:hypothetical protein
LKTYLLVAAVAAIAACATPSEPIGPAHAPIGIAVAR